MRTEVKDINELLSRNQRFQTLCRNVLSSGQGKELLEKLQEIYCDGPLYHDDERTTVYSLGQRDLIMELLYNVKHGDKTE